MTGFDDQHDDSRWCATCHGELPVSDGVQTGWYCCDQYFCSQKCLDKSFLNSNLSDEDWEEHYSDGGDCYHTEWDETPEGEPIRQAVAA